MRGRWLASLVIRTMEGTVAPREAIAFLKWRVTRRAQLLTIEGIHFEEIDRATWGLMADIILNRQYNPSGFEIGPHDVVIDIGAHRGVFLGHVAVRTQAQVVGIEPDPDNFRLLALLVRRNRMKNVELVNAAVAGATGESRLYRGMASSQHTLTGVDVFTGKALPLSQSVKTISLDDLCHGYPTIHFLKMDCEGAEHGIVQSAHDDTLRKINRLVMEIHELAKPDAGKTLLDRLGHFFTRMDFKRTSDHMGLLYATRD